MPFLLTAAALVCFAANSLLCRQALGGGAIDAASFTALRLVSGAAVLALLARSRLRAGSWPAGALLFAYAAAFSFAYLRLSAGVGALLLFGAVQATMIGVAIARGHAPTALEWTGLLLAGAGLVGLTRPGLAAPDPLAALLMAVAGAAWGGYSLLGAGERDPIGATAGNFARTVPFAAVLAAAGLARAHVSWPGAGLALASGVLASGIGYCLWYAALGTLSATRAALVQLTVPMLAALGGILLLGETPTLRLGLGGALILAGVCLAILGRKR